MPGHSIAVVRALKSSLWATAGGNGAEIRPKRFSQAEATDGVVSFEGPAAVLFQLALPRAAAYHTQAVALVGARAELTGTVCTRAGDPQSSFCCELKSPT